MQNGERAACDQNEREQHGGDGDQNAAYPAASAVMPMMPVMLLHGLGSDLILRDDLIFADQRIAVFALGVLLLAVRG